MAAIFISHSSRDGELAGQFKSWLADQGYENVFLDFDKDTGLRAGEQWERQLYEQISRCHAVVLVLTPNWLASKWCFVEFTQARALGKIIFPVVLSPIGDQRVAPEIQGVDLKDWNADGQDYLRRRIREISNEVARGFKWDSSRPPFPGISSFDREDAAIFFGRDGEIREIMERLEGRRVQGGRRLLLVLGASGSGKSSVLKAGVLPQLGRERSHWISLPSFRPERSPVTNFAKCLAESFGQPDGWRPWRDGLMGPDALTFLQRAADDLRVGEARNATLLMAIDQFEEVFTVAGPEERSGFLDLLRLATEPDRGLPYLIVGTVRADVLDELLRSRQFTLPFDNYALRQMPIERLAAVIEGPASVAAVSLEKNLAQRIVADVKSTEALPLLAFALRELYERFGQDHRLTIDDYEKLGDQAAGLTPIENAVRRRADDVLSLLQAGPTDLTALRQAFIPHLVGVRDDGTFVRLPARLANLPVEARRLIDALVDARLLSKRVETGSDSTGNVIVEVSHEALFKAWPLLAGWLGEERDFLAGKAQLDRSLADWRAAQPAQKPDALLQGLQLARARQWLLTHRHGLSEEEATYIRDSHRRVQRRKLTTYALAGACVLIIGIAGARVLYAELVRRTALACDLLAAEMDNNVGVRGVDFDRIDTANAVPACDSAVNADPDNPRLLHNLGRALDAGGKPEQAAQWYRKAIDRNWAWSKNNLGVNYLYGRGVPVDLSQGVALLRAAAEQNNDQARVNLEKDFSTLLEDSPPRIMIVQKALVEKGFLQSTDATGVWGPTTESAVDAFKKSVQIADEGVSLRVFDNLGVIDALSATVAKTKPTQ